MNIAPSSSVPGPVRLLVVDDHPFFREGLVAWIGRQEGLAYCGHAETPAAALVAIDTFRPEVVLLDLTLREGDGMEVLRLLKERPTAPRVIVVSHKDETIFAERCLKAGAAGYVTKEEACDVLRDAIATVRRGEVHVSTLVRRMRERTGPAAEGETVQDRLRSLYNREMQVLELLGRGRSTKEIASELNISPKTVETYRESLKHKLGFANSAELLRFATLRSGGEGGDRAGGR